jgi:hypothetical protein
MRYPHIPAMPRNGKIGGVVIVLNGDPKSVGQPELIAKEPCLRAKFGVPQISARIDAM